VRITSGFGGGEFTKTLRKVCTCQILKFAFLLLEYCKIRECYAVANAFTIRKVLFKIASYVMFSRALHSRSGRRLAGMSDLIKTAICTSLSLR
jgi:hypothetical protein